MVGGRDPGCRWRWLVVLVALLAASPAGARRLTRSLRRAITLVDRHGSPAEAHALEKLFKLQGYRELPLVKGYLDGSIGRDSVRFVERQIRRLEDLRPRRPYLEPALASLQDARGELRRTGYLNWGPTSSPPVQGRVLGRYRFDAKAYRSNVRALAGERTVRLSDPRTGEARSVRLDDRHIGNRDNSLPDTIQFLERHYRALGLRVEREPFSWRGRTLVNLVVTIPGRSKETILLGAHYDTSADARARTRRSDGQRKVSPGADDNASGVAALMEAGRAFRSRSFEKTIKLVHFSGEEQPGMMAGSRAYVRACRAPLAAVFILDAIGHDRGGRHVMLHTTRDERSLFLGSEVARAARDLRSGLKPVGNLPGDGRAISVHDTDSSPFARRGIPTLFVGEKFRWRLGIHDRFDRTSAIDVTHAGKVVTSTLEAVARLAGRADGRRDAVAR